VNTDLGCDRLQDDRRSAAFAPKILREQCARWALGSKLAADVDRNYELITDHFILQYVNRLERTIVNESELPGCFVVKVLIDPEANAYSLPGGFIYLTTGLIALVESEGQLVAALAHETGHIKGQHLTRIDGQAYLTGRAFLRRTRWLRSLAVRRSACSLEVDAKQRI